MEKLSTRKQLNIIRLYFSGLSYREIAAKVGASVGTVNNIITDLRAGNYPEVGDVSEQVDVLKELAAEVRKSRLTVGEAVTGITIVNSLKELGLEPGDIPQYVSLCKALTPGSVETQEFVKAAMEYREVLQRTGLSVDEMEKKVRTLEEASSQLEPMAKKALELQGEIEELERNKGCLTDEMAGLEGHRNMLTESIKEKEQREEDLSTRIAHLEERLQFDEERLAGARKDLKTLSCIGISFDELSGFTERLKGVAHRHGIDPKTLYGRLLTELEQLDKGLSLETLVQTRQLELSKIEGALSKAQEKSAVLDNQNQQLQQELSSLKAQIADERNSIVKELRTVNTTAQNTVVALKQDLSKGIQEGLDEVARLAKESLEAGKEFGKLEAMIKSNAWFEDILSLLRGEDNVTASQVRVVALILLKSIVAWLERNYPRDMSLHLLRTIIANVVVELERWKPQVSSTEGSKSFSAN
jgi:predicted  nucleic acid-binding Zn-ribbon protein